MPGRRPKWATPRASSHPDFHRRSWSSTRSTGRAGLRLGTGRGLSPPVRNYTDPGARVSRSVCHRRRPRRDGPAGARAPWSRGLAGRRWPGLRLRHRRPRTRRRRRSAPASAARSIVAAETPPSTWIHTSSPCSDTARRARRIFGSTSSRNSWPPNPGSTVITSSMSSSGSSRTYGSKGVAGLSAMPARAPSRAQLAGQRTGACGGLDVERDRSSTRLGKARRPTVRVLDHEVARPPESGETSTIRSTTGSPSVRFGTKWLSITSTCAQSAVAMRASSCSRLAKSDGEDAGRDHEVHGLSVACRGGATSHPYPTPTREVGHGCDMSTARDGHRTGPSGRSSGATAQVGRPTARGPQRLLRSSARCIASVPCTCGHSCTEGPSPSSIASPATERIASRASSCSTSGRWRSASLTTAWVSAACGEHVT